MTLLVPAIVLTVGGLGGLFMAILRLRGGNPPLALALVHGAAAVTGVILLAWSVFSLSTPLSMASLIAAVAGAPLGLVMFIQHRKHRLLPLGVLFLHGALELTAVILLWLAVLGV